MSSSSKHPAGYTVAAVSGAMAAFELAASVLARNGPSCSSVLRNTLSIPMTLTEYVDDRMVKRSDEPLWIDDFVVEHQMPEYFCRDTGFRWAMPLVIYISAALFLYQRFRGNRTQDAIIILYAFLGALVGGIASYDFLDIVSGFVPGAIWLSLVCMPLHIEENWKEKQGTLRFE